MALMVVGFESERKSENKSKWHWNCAGALSTSNWRTRTHGLEYYSLRAIESSESMKIAYVKVLKNSNINWKKVLSCSRHWSSGKQENLKDPPDLVFYPEYVQRREILNRP